MLTPANHRGVIGQDIEKNLDLWKDVDRIVGAPSHRLNGAVF
jgi:hypothetical protein